MTKDCLICQRIEKIKENKNLYFVDELETGYVVIGDYQYFEGYTLFLSKYHKKELHELEQNIKIKFLLEMSMVAEAVFDAFKPDKLNYELLGNTDRHMHWHIFPRRKNEKSPNSVIWLIDKTIRNSDDCKPSNEQLSKLKKKISNSLKKVKCNYK